MTNERRIVDFKQLSSELLARWIKERKYLREETKRILFDIGCECSGEISVLYDINKAIVSKQESCIELDGSLSLIFENDKVLISYYENKAELKKRELREVIVGMIDLLEYILPLGSVVDLNKKYLQKHIRVENIENIRIVITHRFLCQEDDTTYFPYAGVAYPVGMFSKDEIIHFTPSLIEKVVHKGYSDIQDEAYIYMMKQELILEKGMHSYGFSTEEEQTKLQKRVDSNE